MADRQLSDLVSGEEPPRHRHAGADVAEQPPAASKPAGNACGWNSASRRSADGRLVSTGLLIVNPPWTLAGELKTILPELEKPLGQGGAARFRLEIAKP